MFLPNFTMKASLRGITRGSILPVRRGLHCTNSWHESAKTAKDLIKFVNTSSLTHAESSSNQWRLDSKVPDWKRQKLALNTKLQGQKWNPKKKLSREQMESIRLLKTQFPHMTATQLGEQFRVSPEVIRRILKSTWQPNEQEMINLQVRWKRRSQRINEKSKSSDEVPHMLPKKLVLSTGRSNTDITIKDIKKFHSQRHKNTRDKQKLALLSNLID
ncbi:LADA_0G06744g1_1 [Lachancea dasiensis]|uniref:Required for respiratory growth protein 9, mitochondrial n=1 Tax=Lachancea dasiensis TaxID=1072105 RepID=A0A1G4JTD3_9SACH|nr:LADA_0G06744g1_1 [Lachancea dasiensis]